MADVAENMAVAATGSVFASETNLEAKEDSSGVISETGIILGAEDIEEFIVVEIEKLHSRNQRANTKAVCKALAKSHGLTERVVSLQLKRMILTCRIEKRFIRGSKSFKLVTEAMRHGNKLARKVSNDEEKAAEYRNDLVQTSTRQEGAEAEGIEQADNSDKYLLAGASRHESEITDAENSECSERSEGICNSSLDSSPDTNSISQMSVTFRYDGNTQKNYVSSSEVIERLEKVEGQVTQILQNLENNEEKKSKNEETKSLKSEISKLLDKIQKLEEENKSLMQKNRILTQEISGLNSRANTRGEEMGVNKTRPPRSEMTNRQIFDSYLEARERVPHPMPENIFQGQNNQAEWRPEVYRSRQHDVIDPYYGWQFPKETARKSNFTTTSSRPLETRNRFSLLECSRDNNLEGRERNVVPGKHTYAEAISKASKNMPQNTTNGQRQQSRTSPESPRLSGKQQSNLHRSQSNGFGIAIRDQTKVRSELPEQRTFNKPTVTIIGDSMLRGVKRNDLSIAAPHVKSFVKTFGGATVDHMHSYMEPSLSMNPDGLIILCGTNNLRRERPDETANKITN